MSQKSDKKQCKTQSNSPYLVYGRNNCGFTQRALQLLDQSKLSYSYLDISDYQSEFFQLCEPKIGKHKTVPVIFYQGEFIGGYDGLVEHLEKLKN